MDEDCGSIFEPRGLIIMFWICYTTRRWNGADPVRGQVTVGCFSIYETSTWTHFSGCSDELAPCTLRVDGVGRTTVLLRFVASIRSLNAAYIQTSSNLILTSSLSSRLSRFMPELIQFQLTIGMWGGMSLRHLWPRARRVRCLLVSVTICVTVEGS